MCTNKSEIALYFSAIRPQPSDFFLFILSGTGFHPARRVFFILLTSTFIHFSHRGEEVKRLIGKSGDRTNTARAGLAEDAPAIAVEQPSGFAIGLITTPIGRIHSCPSRNSSIAYRSVKHAVSVSSKCTEDCCPLILAAP